MRIIQRFLHTFQSLFRSFRLPRLPAFLTFQYWFRGFRLPRLPAFLTFEFYWSIFVLPFVWLSVNWRSRRFQDLMLGLPALVAGIAITYLIIVAQAQEDSLTLDYFSEAEIAVSHKEYPLAQLLLRRVIERGAGKLSEARYTMALLFEELGQQDRAMSILKLLAPEDRKGNRNAHRRMAMMLADQTTWQSEQADIKRLYWHLTATMDDTSPEMAFAWSQYYLAVGDLNAAKKYLENAVKSLPELWQALGTIEATLGNEDAARSSFGRSSDYLSGKLRLNPTDEQSRAEYVQVLLRLGRLEDARLVLEQGKLLNPGGQWSGLLASLAVSYHDLYAGTGKPMSELLSFIDTALTYDPNHGPALNRLMSYANAKVGGNVELRAVLARVIAEGQQPAMAHLAMGNLCWIENDRKGALFHFERAREIRDDIAIVLNNLAWLIAHDETSPDFERALALVNSALEKRPNSGDFLDTRGTVYFLQKNWKSALVDFEKALSNATDKRAVHEKLAVIYKELGMVDIAEQHTKMIQELDSKATGVGQ